ncbi:unnamed protein product, partial [Meganyctiphanes norvegica]
YTQFNCVEDGFYVDPQQCDKYYHCSRGQYTEKLCPDGLIFDDTLGPRIEQCNYNFIVSCPEGKTQQQAQPSGINNECPRQNGLFEHEDPTNCKTYYDCVNGVPNTRECHADLHFDEFSGVCDWASKVFRSGCEDRPSTDGDSGFDGSNENGTIPSGNDVTIRDDACVARQGIDAVCGRHEGKPYTWCYTNNGWYYCRST